MKHAHALLSAAAADKAMAFAVTAGVLLVIILLARAVGRLSKLAGAAAAPAPVPRPPGGGGVKFLLLALAGGGAWFWAEGRHRVAAVPAAPAPSPSPSPLPAVTRTVTPHVAVHAHPWLTGGDVVAIYIIGAVVAIVLGIQALRRSS